MKSSLMLGVNPETIRQSEDFYATNPKALVLFLDKLSEDGIGLNYKVWECAVGMGHLADVLLDYGYEVRATDIVDRGYPNTYVLDFLTVTEKWDGDILTNPPFKLAEKFLEKGMELLEKGNKLFLFLKIQFLEGQKRKELFKTYPPKYVYCYSSRQQCCRDAEFEKFTATTQFYAWYIWEKGFKGETTIRWI
jgi:hypothetical protein